MTEAKDLLESYLAEGSQQMGINIDAKQMAAFKQFYFFLIQENKKYNLTTIVGEKEVAVKHFLDSLACLKWITAEVHYVIDLGTGAGFPGIPLKICRPDIQLLLLDSVRKKVEFLSALVNKMGLSEVETLWERAENAGMASRYREKGDMVVSRAVAPLNVLAELCLPLVKVGGFFLAMKGPSIQDELPLAETAIERMGGRVESMDRFTLPLISEERTIVIMRKHKATPKDYPRRAGVPAKKPLSGSVQGRS